MIFGTVGTHAVPFDRLFRALDAFASTTDEPVIVQCGPSSYIPRSATWFPFASSAEFLELLTNARVVVTAGGDTVLEAIALRRPVIVVPRRRAYGEAVDDHQVDLAAALSRRKFVRWCEPDQLTDVLARSDLVMPPRAGDRGRQRLIWELRKAIGFPS